MVVSEPFEATDANGIKVTGTVDVGRERDGDFFNPASPNYKQPRFANFRFEYFNASNACRIEPKTLEAAMRDALRKALIRFGINGPDDNRISADVSNSLEATRQQCTENADKLVSSETYSAADWETGKPVGHVTARAYAAVPTPDGGVRKVVARENTWPAGDVTSPNTSGRDADMAAAGNTGEAVQSNGLVSNDRLPILPIGFEGQAGQKFVPPNPQVAESPSAHPHLDVADSGVPRTGLLNMLLGQTEAATVPRLPSTDEMVKLANVEAENSARPARYLSRRITGRVDTSTGEPGASAFGFDSAAVPLVPSDDTFASGGLVSRAERFGSQTPRGLEPTYSTTLPGIVSGKPMDYSLPRSIFGFPPTPAPNDEDWLLQLLAPRRGR